MTYDISIPVTRIMYGDVSVSVEADNLEDAKKIAKETWMMEPFEWSCDDGDMALDCDDSYFDDEDNWNIE